MNAPRDLLGRLRLRPGVAMPDGIVGGRPDLSALLLRGQPAAAAIDRVALLHTLCASAHRLVAQRAVTLARTGEDAAPDAATLDALAADITREHARRIGHDWSMAWTGTAQAAALGRLQRSAPAQRQTTPPAGDAFTDALADAWLAQEWLGMSPASWLREATRADGATGPLDVDRVLALLRRSATARPDGIAPVLVQAVQRSIALPFMSGPIGPNGLNVATCLPTPPLRPDDPQQARAWGDAMRTPGYCRAPTWAGGVPDTGPWNRLDLAPTTVAMATIPLPARLLSRWIELLRLAMPKVAGSDRDAPGLAWRPAHGAVCLGEAQALAWVETSRGLLAHRVSLDGHTDSARVVDWQVLAPTEWNFHPRGTLAQSLAAWPADHPDTPEAVRLLACAYDPCMACEIDTRRDTARHGESRRHTTHGGPPCMS